MKSERKSPWRALVLSALIFPGAGQIYNGDRLKGYLLIALGIILTLLIILKVVLGFMGYYQALLGENPQVPPGKALSEEIPGILIFLGVFGVLWIYGMVDAYLGGKE